ncbi:hypothetical protein NFI96_028687, partial [Prochilodus magdalenae]
CLNTDVATSRNLSGPCRIQSQLLLVLVEASHEISCKTPLLVCESCFWMENRDANFFPAPSSNPSLHIGWIWKEILALHLFFGGGASESTAWQTPPAWEDIVGNLTCASPPKTGRQCLCGHCGKTKEHFCPAAQTSSYRPLHPSAACSPFGPVALTAAVGKNGKKKDSSISKILQEGRPLGQETDAGVRKKPAFQRESGSRRKALKKRCYAKEPANAIGLLRPC